MIPNTIVLFEVARVYRCQQGGKLVEIRGHLVRPVALCHSGDGLYQDGDRVYERGDSSLGLEMGEFRERVRAIVGVRWPRVPVRIDKDRYIYDREMPQMSYEIEEVAPGQMFKGLVVEVRRSNEIVVSVQNSKIVGCKQEPIETHEDEPLIRRREKREFHKLGIVP